jgi:hypothetical protein
LKALVFAIPAAAAARRGFDLLLLIINLVEIEVLGVWI